MYSVLAIVAARRYLRVRPPHSRELESRSAFSSRWPGWIRIWNPTCVLSSNRITRISKFCSRCGGTDDPAVEVVEKLRSEYPWVSSRLIVTGEPPYPNAKVYSLDCMLAEAAHDLVVMSDSDIRVTPDLLRTVAAEFQDPKLGVATCPYRAMAGASLWSRLEATGMNADFLAGHPGGADAGRDAVRGGADHRGAAHGA